MLCLYFRICHCCGAKRIDPHEALSAAGHTAQAREVSEVVGGNGKEGPVSIMASEPFIIRKMDSSPGRGGPCPFPAHTDAFSLWGWVCGHR